MTITHVVVDGSNIATEGRDAPSLAQLDEAVQAFIEEYAPQHVTVVVDATFPNRIDRKERQTYEDAVNANELITPPAGAIGRGDAFILQIARRAGAAILSNDSFQEFHGEYPWLFERGRLIGGKPVPHVGWVFMDRAPVRGPTSRRAVSDARKVAAKVAKVAKVPKAAKAAKAAAEPVETDRAEESQEAPPPRRRRTRTKAPVAAPPVDATSDGDRPDPVEVAKLDDEAAAEGAGRAKGGRSPEPYNEAMPFIEFVAAHPVGSEVEATIERFSSHGAYVMVDSARAYVPLRNLAEPAPRSAKEVVRLGEKRRFIVVAVDTPRRGIDLALPGVVDVPVAEPSDTAGLLAELAVDVTDAAAEGHGTATEAAEAPSRTRSRRTAKAPAEKGAKTPAATKAATKRTPAKKAAAGKSPAKKAAAKRSAAKKAPARSAAATPTDERASDEPLTAEARPEATASATAEQPALADVPAGQPDAAGEPAEQGAARTTSAKRGSAKKAPAKQTTKKATAKKATAKKAAAEGDEPTAEKPAKRSGGRKASATATKAPADKTAAKRSPSRRTPSRKGAAAAEAVPEASVVPLVTGAQAPPEAAEG